MGTPRHAQANISAFTRSPPKMRIRSSSSERKKREEPGSPCVRASRATGIDAPRLVAFRAKDVQSTKRDDFVVSAFALPSKLLVDRLPLIGGT